MEGFLDIARPGKNKWSKRYFKISPGSPQIAVFKDNLQTSLNVCAVEHVRDKLYWRFDPFRPQYIFKMR
jgi:hypothetical protein